MVDAAGTTKYSYAILGYGLSTVTEDGPWDYDVLTVTNRGGLRGGFMLTQPASQFVVTNQYDALKRLTTVGGTAGTFLYHYTNGVPASGVQGEELYRRYEIYVTDDSSGSPASWGAPVASEEWFWPSRQERKDVRFTPKTGRYVYFRRMTSWGWYGLSGYASANEIWVYETTSNGGGSAITTPLVTAATLATNAVLRNDFSGWVGCRLQVGHTETPTYYWAASSNTSYVPVGMKFWTGTNEPTWVAASERWYVYDGMLVVQERDKNNVPKVSYTRGLRLSGSRQGAGGIGGLLARSEHGTSSPYAISRTDCYHADGNGNITALVDTNSALSASYQYDPYGNVMSSSGAMKDANVYRFSSKMFHPNSGLYYYGYRFYDPNLQRWPNRDPIGEEGGVNLYGFAGNHMPNAVDMLGLKIKCKGDHKDFYEGVINCWRNSLPPDSQLRKLVKDLDDSADTYEVCDMRPEDRETNQVP